MASKRYFLALLVLTTLFAPVAHAALPPPTPVENPFVPKIVEISPAEALPGQVITVRTASPPFIGSRTLRELQNRVTSLISAHPLALVGIPQPPKIWFANSIGQTWVLGGPVTALGDGRYSVVVPQNAHSGKLRFENSIGSSYSTVNFTLVTAGYSIVNLSQFDVVSVKVDNVERLSGQPLPAVAQTDLNVFVADVGTMPGNHSVQITLGPSLDQPVIVYQVTAEATTSMNIIEVGIMAAGEYLTASPNAVGSGNNITASWQTLIVGPNGTLSVNGFEITRNTSTGALSWVNWFGDKTNVVASGTIAEPANWPLNPDSVTLQLRRGNGALYSNITVDLLNKSFVAADGNTYELQ